MPLSVVFRFFLRSARHMFSHCSVSFVLMSSVLWAAPYIADADHYFFPKVRYRIEQQVKAEIQQRGFTCQGEIICGLQVIPNFYQQRGYSPVWFDSNGLRPAVQALMQTIREAGQDGLTPSDYHLETLENVLDDLSNGRFPPDDAHVKLWADLDLILTDAFLLLGSHLSGGRINPQNIHADWLIGPRSFDMLTLLDAALTEAQLQHVLNQFRPIHDGYTNLRLALQQMKRFALEDDLPQLQASGKTIRPSESDEDVPTIRWLLQLFGDFDNDGPPEKPKQYDADLVAAVKKFQQRHGLEPDGIIGKKSRAAIAFTIDQRIRQIELNLERWRWLPRDLGNRYVFVNTAAFYLKVIEDNHKKLDMKVVVGRPARQSPVFSTHMTYMVLNPYWNVPHKIAVQDILPKLADDVDYLINQNFRVYNDWSADAPELDPYTIDWKNYGNHYFPLRFRQDPGKKNALGQIKFMFPNKFAVYLHDTPQKSLFTKFQRDFSSGCIRVEDAKALAMYLLSDNPNWTQDMLVAKLDEGNRQVVHIPTPIAIHLLYMTAWVDEKGILQFREDIYQRDDRLDTALTERNPYPLTHLTAAVEEF